MQGDLMAAVYQAVEALPQQQRAALLLRMFQGLEYDVVAEALGCSSETARARQSANCARVLLRSRVMGGADESGAWNGSGAGRLDGGGSPGERCRAVGPGSSVSR
jgi:hypothetical protein